MTTAFGLWLGQQVPRRDEVGSLARLVEADRKRLRAEGVVADHRTPTAVRARLTQQGAPLAEFAALDAAEREWRAIP